MPEKRSDTIQRFLRRTGLAVARPSALVAEGALIACLLAAAPTHGQSTWVPERTAFGQPDLQGVWDYSTLTPLERPARYGNQAVLSEEEVAALEARSAARTERQDAPSDPDRGAPAQGANVGSYNSFWMDHPDSVTADRRTSLIVDPPNGRIPPLVPGAKRQVAGDDLPTDLPVRTRARGVGTEGPENRGLSERCVQGFNTGPPITPRGYNENIQIFQTADYVVILNEMIHEARIIPLDNRPRHPEIRGWLGESRGHWEGDTLVIETENLTSLTSSFSPNTATAYGTGETLHLIERFERVDANTLRYEFTVNDPATFTAPFTAVQFMRKSDGKIYEYACHEGNYALRNILLGARMAERERSE